MGNNERSPGPPRPRGSFTGDVRREGIWKGDELWFRGTVVASIVQDQKYPVMWRVRMPSGELSDMVNRIRAKEAAYSLVGKCLT